MNLSSIESALKKLRTEDDRLSEVINQLLKLTTEIEKIAKTADDALARAKRAESQTMN